MFLDDPKLMLLMLPVLALIALILVAIAAASDARLRIQRRQPESVPAPPARKRAA